MYNTLKESEIILEFCISLYVLNFNRYFSSTKSVRKGKLGIEVPQLHFTFPLTPFLGQDEFTLSLILNLLFTLTLKYFPKNHYCSE